MKKSKEGGRKDGTRFLPALLIAGLAAASAGAAAQVPGPTAEPGAPLLSDKSRAIRPQGHKSPAIGSSARAQQNCGTFWTPRVEDPEADVNPCPKECERGERQLVDTYKQGDKTVYAARYQCYRIPVVAKRPPPDDSPFGRARAQIEKPGAKPAGTIEPAGGAWGVFARLKGPGFGRATGVVGLWYPNDDTSQLPAMRTSVTLGGRPGPDELRIQIPLDPARTGSRGDFSKGTLHIVLQMPEQKAAVYGGAFAVGGAPTVAQTLGQPPLVPAPRSEPAGRLKHDPRDRFRPRVITTEAMLLTGNRRPSFVPRVFVTEAIQLTGNRRPPFVPKVISTEAIRLTGTRPTLSPLAPNRRLLPQSEIVKPGPPR